VSAKCHRQFVSTYTSLTNNRVLFQGGSNFSVWTLAMLRPYSGFVHIPIIFFIWHWNATACFFSMFYVLLPPSPFISPRPSYFNINFYFIVYRIARSPTWKIDACLFEKICKNRPFNTTDVWNFFPPSGKEVRTWKSIRFVGSVDTTKAADFLLLRYLYFTSA